MSATMDEEEEDHPHIPPPLLHPFKNASLSINKSSKISKSIKKPSSSSAPRPIAKIYADPSEFRRVVQELTGTNAPPAPAPQPPPPPPKATRLQRIAPPPLTPSFPASHLTPPLQPLHPLYQPINPQNLPHLPMLSPQLFAPLPVLTPGDNAWANPLELSVNLFHQQNRTIDGAGPGRTVGTTAVSQSSTAPPSSLVVAAAPTSAPPAARFPWTSPGIWSPRFLPSPLPLSPNFLPPLSPSLLSPGFFPPLSGFPSPRSPGLGFTNMYNTFGMTGSAPPPGSSQDFTFQGPSGVGANRLS